MSAPPRLTPRLTSAQLALAARRLAQVAPQAQERTTGAHYAHSGIGAVSTARASGGKRKGRKMSQAPRTTQAPRTMKSADITSALAHDASAQAHVTKSGLVKRIDYRRAQ